MSSFDDPSSSAKKQPPPIRAWLRASAVSKPLLTALCALSERLAQATVCLEPDGTTVVHLLAPRRARLPAARFSLESREEAMAACSAIGASSGEAQALLIVTEALRSIYEPNTALFKSLMSEIKSDLLNLARSLPMDSNLPGGVDRDDPEAQDAFSDAIEEPATRAAALEIARLLIHPEHPLSSFVGALISEADSEDIESALESAEIPSGAPTVASLVNEGQPRSFSRSRSL